MPWPFRSAKTAGRADFTEVQTWARQRAHVFKPVREGGGFVIEGGRPPLPWRIEWGPSTRRYIPGNELRVRVETGLPPEVQALILNRGLMTALERDVFAEATTGVQTVLDDALPEEMRWLAMLGKVTTQPWFAPLREAYGGVGNAPDWMAAWLLGRLTEALLLRLQPGALDEPFVLSMHRGRLTLRRPLAAPQPTAMEQARLLAELAAFEAQRADAPPAR